MSFFGVELPQSSEITVKIRLVTGPGRPLIAWQGSTDANEVAVLEEICKSPVVCSFIKKAARSRRIHCDENGAYRIQAKIICYESGQVISEAAAEIPVYPIEEDGDDSRSRNNPSDFLGVMHTLVNSLVQREQHMEHMLEHVNRLHSSYERAISAISQHSLQAMDKVSGHAASAFSSAAAPFADMSKSLVKSLDDSRAHSATSAKDSQDLLIEALKNRIIESNQVSKPSVAEDIKDVMQLWPMFKGFLGEADPKPQS